MKSHLTILLKRPSPLTTTPRFTTLFTLPPSIRTRSFHASPRPQYLDTALLGTQAALDSLHTITGLPWAYTLPLSALLIRLTLVLPISLYHRSLLQRQLHLFPLLSSWKYILQSQISTELAKAGKGKSQKGAVLAQNMLLRRVRAKRQEVYARFGVQSWKTMSLPFVQLPVFLILIETIRKMAGREEGLMGMLWGRISQLFSSGDKTLPEGIVGVGEEVVKQTVQLKPSLATEGILWFPDLLVADPQMILPFMLSGAIMLNIFGKMPNAVKAQGNGGVWPARLKRILATCALVIGPLTINVPSAMLWYWFSSSMFAYIQAVLLELWRPFERSAKPCEPKRPLVNGLGKRWKVENKEG